MGTVCHWAATGDQARDVEAQRSRRNARHVVLGVLANDVCHVLLNFFTQTGETIAKVVEVPFNCLLSLAGRVVSFETFLGSLSLASVGNASAAGSSTGWSSLVTLDAASSVS